MGQTVLVTGSSGKIGRAVVADLQRRGHTVRGLDRVPSPVLPATEIVDLGDRPALERAMVGVDCLVHLAATPDDEDFIRQLITDAVAASPAFTFCPEPIRSKLLDMQVSARIRSVRANFPQGRNHILVDGSTGETIGWLFVADLPEELRLVEIAMIASRRGEGLGTAVISGLLAEAREAGKPVRLAVDVLNHAALRLYLRLGFRIVASDEARHQMEKRPD